jgi:hypothetical protein
MIVTGRSQLGAAVPARRALVRGVRLAGAGLCLLFSNFRFGMAETGSIFYGDRF